MDDKIAARSPYWTQLSDGSWCLFIDGPDANAIPVLLKMVKTISAGEKGENLKQVHRKGGSAFGYLE